MKYTEVMVCILIFLILALGFMQGYVTFMRGRQRFINSASLNAKVLMLDRRIRNDLNELNMPFWRNPAKLENEIYELLTAKNMYSELNILSCKVQQSSEKDELKLIVSWEYIGKSFTSEQGIGERLVEKNE